MMKREDYWMLFQETGIPELYVAYCHAETENGRDPD